MEHQGQYKHDGDAYGGDLPEEEAADAKAKESEGVKMETARDRRRSGSTSCKRMPRLKRRSFQLKVFFFALGGFSAATQAVKQEQDSRSVYVGNVDYNCSTEELRRHFLPCGAINRVTILHDQNGHPKGFAYVEFAEVDSVHNALLLNESELLGRELKVCAKRTNVPRLRQHRWGYPSPYSGSRTIPPGSRSYGRTSRIRRRYRPY
ncbi:polyadenylate-binding protein 1 isoform X2 [Andrographis paniculata]|uniref:polyadenylate-binding protein 1 isoform X2 n=1 Tax=Andrographis paniculata TaxID=175694 RepID=UPI0021E7BC99|nr:polyadenylate-binding protein 1 isoform X2 [Andrographis paniculata]